MKHPLNLAGRTFGALRTLEPEPRMREDGGGRKTAYWLCECICGNQREYRASRLASGYNTSCGCLGYRKDPDRHKDAREKVPARKRRKIAKLGGNSRKTARVVMAR